MSVRWGAGRAGVRSPPCADHLGISCPSSRLERIADGLYGESPTFFRGKIGRWREAFRDEHLRAFREVAGDLAAELGYDPA